MNSAADEKKLLFFIIHPFTGFRKLFRYFRRNSPPERFLQKDQPEPLNVIDFYMIMS